MSDLKMVCHILPQLPPKKTKAPQTGYVAGKIGLYLLLRTFWSIRMRASTPQATPVEEMCGPQGRLCCKINHIWSHSAVASWSA